MIQFTNRTLSATRALFVAGVLTAVSTAFWAQANPPAPPPDGMHQHGPSVERQLGHLTEILSLTPAQQAQVKDLLTAQREQMEALHKSAPGTDATAEPSRPDHQQMEAIHNATDTKIAALLNEDQKTKFAAWQQERKQRMEHRRGQPDQQAPSPNSPGN